MDWLKKLKETYTTGETGETPLTLLLPEEPTNVFTEYQAGEKREKTAPDIGLTQLEYMNLLDQFWKLDDDPNGNIEDARQLVVRLDELYRILTTAGTNVPVRLPVKKRIIRSE